MRSVDYRSNVWASQGGKQSLQKIEFLPHHL